MTLDLINSHPLRVLVGAGAVILVLLLVLAFLAIRHRRFNPKHFKTKWDELQKFCASKETWPMAIIMADELLNEALKKKHLKGKSMGERMVSAQRQLTDNDAVWYAHNLSKKLASKADSKLRQTDVKKSLMGVRRALRDLGVMDSE